MLFLYVTKTGWEMEQKLGDGMYEKMKQHDEALNDHDVRLNLLEENDRQHEERLKQLEDQSVRLENTVMAESRETRNTMKEQTEKLFKIVDTSINYKADSQKLDYDLKKLRVEMWSDVFLKLTGGIFALLSAGGIGYWLLQQLVGGN